MPPYFSEGDIAGSDNWPKRKRKPKTARKAKGKAQRATKSKRRKKK